MVRGGQVAVLALVAGLATGCTEEAAPPTSGSTARSDPTSSSPSTPSAPVLGAWHELVTLDDEVILVNGHPEDEAAPDAVELWTWSGAGWERARTSGNGPSGRNFAAVTVDTDSGRLVLYGGLTADGPSDETWTWDGATWTSVSEGAGPGPRSSPSMAYDAASGLTVLYGGDDGSEQYSDTWALDGAAWRRVDRRGPRPVRWPATMEADPEGGVVLYGGHQVVDEDGPLAVGDTWVWRGDSWMRVPDGSGAGRPGPLVNAASLVHPRHGLLLLGGGDLRGRERGRVWRWTGTGWDELPPDLVPGRQAFGAAYDPERDVVVMTGGLVEPGSTERRQDVWEWSGDLATPAERVG